MIHCRVVTNSYRDFILRSVTTVETKLVTVLSIIQSTNLADPPLPSHLSADDLPFVHLMLAHASSYFENLHFSCRFNLQTTFQLAAALQ